MIGEFLPLIGEQPINHASGGGYAAIEKNSGNYRFQGSRQVRRLVPPSARFLPFPHIQEIAEPDIPGHAGESLPSHQRGAETGHISLTEVRKLLIQLIGDDKVQNRITEEFESFIMTKSKCGGFIDVRTVNEGLFQQRRPAKRNPQGFLQFSDIRHGEIPLPVIQ